MTRTLPQAGLDLPSPAGNETATPSPAHRSNDARWQQPRMDPTSPTGGVFAIQRMLGLVSPNARLGRLEEIQCGPPSATPDRPRAGIGAGRRHRPPTPGRLG